MLVTPKTNGGKILAMDDERYIRAITAGMLSSLGYEVATATDGSEAVEMYREAVDSGEPYDAVILDLSVHTGMGGKKTIQRLMEIDPEVRAIASDIYSNTIVAGFRDHGFRGFVGKPYGIKQLDEALHRVIPRKYRTDNHSR